MLLAERLYPKTIQECQRDFFFLAHTMGSCGLPIVNGMVRHSLLAVFF